ncbi:MAG: ferredoxin [Candidatus Zixiibacteriota bacterium]
MLANYGYADGSGEYYITIDTDGCLKCAEHPCITACPKSVFEIIEDDYDDLVAALREEHRKSIKYVCAECKPLSDRPPLPCITVCPYNSISHTW